MNFYDEKILPILLDLTCSMEPAMELRRRIVPLATGKVLEVGMGSGLNLSLYNADQVDYVWGLEPSHGMRDKAQKHLKESPVEVKWLDLPGEKIPLDDESVDTVLLTFTLCTIPDWEAALKQMHRVMKPGAKLLFCEHGLSPDGKVQKWQDRITPMWKKIAGGCHLNRPIRELIEQCGFTIDYCENLYMKGPRFIGYMYIGQASKAA